MQYQYTMVPVVWKSVERLREEYVEHLREVQDRLFYHFSFLRDIDEGLIVTFENILTQLILNMQIRLPCPSTGFDVRQARNHLDPNTQKLEEVFLKGLIRNCPLFIMVGIFLFPGRSYKTKENQ